MARILVLEDDKSMNEILVSTLSDDDYEVTAAFTGLQAIELCRKEVFDLLITDVRLPGADGVETLGELKKIQPALKCIVITGYASQDTPIRAIRLEVDDYLFKPFSLKYFLRSVERVLSREEDEECRRALFEGALQGAVSVPRQERDSKLAALVCRRESVFQALFVGIRSGYLNQEGASAVYSSLESLESTFRRLLTDGGSNSLQIAELQDCYIDIQEQLALMEVGAVDDSLAGERLPEEQFGPIFKAVRDSEIGLGELLYAPLLRRTPDSRFETLSELLELKRKLWPATARHS